MNSKFYITTTLPYVNAEPHIGFAMEMVQADIIARYRKLAGDEVFYNTGTDEHGLKIYRKAVESEKEPQAYADEYAEKFRSLKKTLNLSDDLHFVRTTDGHHKKAAQEFWKLCEKNGDIYKGVYKTKYCVGCELEKTDSELADGRCPAHPNLDVEIIDEENYFFKFSKYGPKLLEFYEKHPDFVLPETRFREIKNFVYAGLNDFSISRLKEKMPWGIEVSGDGKHVMYVWFDALINYISTLGWPENGENFENFWGTKELPNAIQIAGKDQVRQQAAMWQAMLMSADLPNSKQILIHGFVTSNGQKMSKSLGNVVDPVEIIEQYGTDAFRYYVAREFNMFDDSDFTWDKFKESYNANLANGLGNLVSRVMKMATANGIEIFMRDDSSEWAPEYEAAIGKYELHKAINFIWSEIAYCDNFIQQTEPFKKIKDNPEGAKEDIKKLLLKLNDIATLLKPFMPETSEKILEAIKTNSEIKTPLFPRK